jgi:hypothetical protein
MKKVTFFILLFTACALYLHAADPLKEYTGKYKLPVGSVVTEVNVVFDNGVLSLTSAMGTTAITKATADTFSIPNYNGTAVFTRNDQKKINGIKIDVLGISLEGIKEEKETIGSSVLPLPVNKAPFPMKYMPTMLQGDIED